MSPSNLLYVIVTLLFASSLASNDSANVYPSPENYTESRLEVPPRIDVNDSSSIAAESENPRDKRALGVILQGLVEALGYTVSPITYASLPNPNTTSPPPPAPPPKPIATSGSAPAAMTTMAPRQRETLRFTGVVNFGNNSDLLGHLQQYERIFHGNATTTAAPPPARPPPPGPASGKPALLTPYFVPIPLPLAPNLPPLPLPPSAPRRAQQTEVTYAKQKVNENYERESAEISDERDVRKDPPGRDSDRDTYIDEPRWKKKQREKDEEERKKYREENREAESEEEIDGVEGKNKYREEEVEGKNKYREEEVVDREEDEDSKKRDQRVEEKESVEEEREEDDKSPKREDDEGEDSPEGEEYTKKSEDADDGRENASSEGESEDEDGPVKIKGDEEDTTSRSDYERLSKPFGYSPTICPPTPKQFGNRLPIRVFDEPFSIRGELRNSYGESLEQDGKIDESVADFFQKYKHPETGLFDSRRVQGLQALKEKDLWWRNDRASAPGITGDPLERIRQEYAAPAKKHEEYDSEGQEDEAGEQKGREDEPKETYDEEVESTEVKSEPVKGRDGTPTSKNTIQYPRVPANRRYEEYNSERKYSGVGEQKGRQDSPKETYDEEVESTEVKSGPANGRDGTSTSKSTIQYPRVPANRRYEEYNSERKDGGLGEQKGRHDSLKETYDEEVESPEVKFGPAKGRDGTPTSRNTIQYPRVPASRRYEEYNSERKGGVGVQRGRKEDSEAEDYDERVESTEPKYRPVTRRGGGRTFKDTIQEPRVPANRRYEEYNPKSRSREEDPEERKYDERAESTEVKSGPVKGREGATTSKNTIQQARLPAKTWYEQYNSDGEDGEVGEEGSRKKGPEEEYDERVESTEPKYRPVTGRGRGRTFKDSIQQPRVPDSRYEEYGSKSDYGEEGKQRSREEDPEERKYDERAESTEVKSRPVKGREGTPTSKNTIQHARVPAKTWYEQYDSEMKDGEVEEQGSRKKDSKVEYDEEVESAEPKYRPVTGRGRGRTFKDTIQQPRVPADSRYEEYGSKRNEEYGAKRNGEYGAKSHDGEVGDQRSREEDPEDKKYDERVESTEAKDRSVTGRGRARTSKNTVQQPRAPATTRYEEYNLPREDDEVGEQRGRKEESKEKDYERVQTTDARYRPVKGRSRAFKSNEEDERSGPSLEDGRAEVREKEETSRDEDSKDEIAEPTVTTYTRINSLEEIGKPNYADGSEEAEEASQYAPSSGRINLPDYDSAEEATGLSKFQLLDPKNPLLFKGFDFIKYSPYFRPIQVSYEPAKLQRTAARILSYHNFGEDASEDKSRSSEQLRDKNVGSSQRLAASAVGGDEYIAHNPYLKPIQVAYEPEKLQRTAERILSHHNSLGPYKSREDAKHERSRNEDERKEEAEEKKEGAKEQKEDRSENNSKENDRPSQSHEEQDGRSADTASEDDGPSQSREQQDGRSADTASEDAGPSHNYEDRENPSVRNSNDDDAPSRTYEDRENSSVGNSNEDDAPSRNYEEPEDRSSVNRETENDVKPGVGLPERLTGKKLHEGESKELRAWPAPFDHTFDSTERAKVVRHPKSKVSTKIGDEDVEPTYETPALLEFQSTRPTRNYPADSDVAPTYETRWSLELRASGPTAHYPLDSDVSPTDESPSVENSPSSEPRSNSKIQRRPQSEAKQSSVPSDDLGNERKQTRVTKVDAKIRATVQPSPHREVSESPNSRDSNPTVRLQIFEPNESKDFSEEVGENLRPTVQPRKFDDPESAHDFFGFGRDDYVLKQDANNAPKYGEHVQKTTTPSESSEKELMGLLVISHDPNHQHEVTLTKFTDEPETETERVKVNEYRNKVATLKVSEQRQSTPHGPVQHVGYTRSL